MGCLTPAATTPIGNCSAKVSPTSPHRCSGGCPATGAIAGTAVNVCSGARTRVAAIVHALVLVLVVFFAGPLVARIPLPALAGVLMVTAVRMVEVHNVGPMFRATRSDAVVLVVTATVTVAFDLILAVEVGVAVAAVLALRAVARTATAYSEPVGHDIDLDAEQRLLHDHIVTYRLDGAVFFGASHRFLTELTTVADVQVVILRLPDVQVLDATGAQALGEIVATLEQRHVTMLLKGADLSTGASLTPSARSTTSPTRTTSSTTCPPPLHTPACTSNATSTTV